MAATLILVKCSLARFISRPTLLSCLLYAELHVKGYFKFHEARIIVFTWRYRTLNKYFLIIKEGIGLADRHRQPISS